MNKYTFLPHTADIKFVAYGKNLEEVFKNSALAVANTMFNGDVKKKISKKIKVRGSDLENLLYNFLDEVIYLFDAENFLLSGIKNLKIDAREQVPGATESKKTLDSVGEKKNGFDLNAELIGDDAGNYEIREHIKSVTYHDMFIKKDKNKFVTQVVLDV